MWTTSKVCHRRFPLSRNPPPTIPTVGTITEIYDYLRLLFARAGEPRCPDHGQPLEAQTVSQMVDQVMAMPEDSKLMILAPVIRDRKGEHLQVVETMRSQGFIRLRIDGIVYDIDDLPTLDKKRKHQIDVVVDRFKVKPGLEQRLAESFETALALADGIALVAPMSGDGEEHTFSARYACTLCGYSLSELEPRLFSFNNPAGACPTCDGLGVKQFFDPEKIVQHPEANLAAGAIKGWDRRAVYYFQMLTSVAEHYDVDMETPWVDLPEDFRQKLLYGSSTEDIPFRYVNSRCHIMEKSV